MKNEDKAWLDYRARFSDIYDESNYTSPLQSAVMRASHRLTEKHFKRNDIFSEVLEIGAGTGEHVGFVQHGFDRYVLTDMDAKALEVAKRKLGEKFENKLIFETQSGEGLTYADNSFDRLIATHVLEHIHHPQLVLKEWARVVKSGGVLSILIPTDPGLAWRLGRHFGPRKNAIAQGIAYDYVMAREHVNSCSNLIALLYHYFPDRTEAWWPFPVPSIDLNLFLCVPCRSQKGGGLTMLVQITALLCVIGITIGQILFKLSANYLGQTGSYFAPKTAAILFLAFAIYGISTLAWIWVLQRVELGRVYPLMALAFVLVPLCSYFVFGEKFSAQYFVGVSLISLGIVVAVKA